MFRPPAAASPAQGPVTTGAFGSTVLIKTIASRLAAALVALPLMFFASWPAWSGPETQDSPAAPVTEAIEAAPTPTDKQVLVGAYINDIQQIDFKTNSYSVDLYVWFRWTNPKLDPAKTMEFMNRFAGGDNVRELVYDEPQKLPDGSLYSFVRYQGFFSTKFNLETYPFDSQYLTVVMEDSISDISDEVYAPDGKNSIAIDPEITLPGFKVGKPEMKITTNIYPTNFGYFDAAGGRCLLKNHADDPGDATGPRPVAQDLRADPADRSMRFARLLHTPDLRRSPHRSRHHGVADAGCPPADSNFIAPRSRVCNDDR
jgi:hypothetical protein